MSFAAEAGISLSVDSSSHVSGGGVTENPAVGASSSEIKVDAAAPVKRAPRVVKRIVKKQPWETMLAESPSLQKALAVLPRNYEFEVPKTIYKILEQKAQVVALQFPEGLLFCACMISDILVNFTKARVIILSDVTYGACCVDDFSAEKLGTDLLVHYGHSCLVPIQDTRVKTMYVFVEIFFQCEHLISMLKTHFAPDMKIAIQGTVQFLRAVSEAHSSLENHFARIDVPQVKPLSPGETLGCTAAPLKDDVDALVFVADGRFHMEAAMIRNHHLTLRKPAVSAETSMEVKVHSYSKHSSSVAKQNGDDLSGENSAETDNAATNTYTQRAGGPLRFFRYDPYSKKMTIEAYDTPHMLRQRKRAIDIASLPSKQTFGVILGTLGHQGNPHILARLTKSLEKARKTVIPFLMAELSPQKLQRMAPYVDVWVQIACPRLSIDWASREYEQAMGLTEDEVRPVLTPYECLVAIGETPWQARYLSSNISGVAEQAAADHEVEERHHDRYKYPMDYYSNEQNAWSNYYKEPAAGVTTKATPADIASVF